MQQRPSSPRVPEGPDSAYHFAPAIGARFVGGLLVLLAIVLVLATVVVALTGLPLWVLVLVALLGALGIVVGGWLVTRRIPVVRFDAQGYRVRLVRGVGVTAASWTEVTEAGTATPGGTPVLVIALRDGRSTTIPVQVLAADRELLVRDLQARLDTGHGLRPL